MARVDGDDQLIVDRVDGRGLFRARVGCVDQLTFDRIDRYDRMALFRASVDCVDQLTVDRIRSKGALQSKS